MAKDMDNPDDARELTFVDGEPVPVENKDDEKEAETHPEPSESDESD